MKKGFLLYKDRMYVPNVPKVKLLILDKIHQIHTQVIQAIKRL